MDELLSFQMYPEDLSVPEIVYELGIRDMVVSGTSRNKLMALQKALQNEEQPPMIQKENDEEFNHAVEALQGFQQELKTVISNNDTETERKIKSKIRHIQDRAFRAMGKDEEKDAILYGLVRIIKRIIRQSVEERASMHSRDSARLDVPSDIHRSGMGKGRGRGIAAAHSKEKIEELGRREASGSTMLDQAQRDHSHVDRFATQYDDLEQRMRDLQILKSDERFRDVRPSLNSSNVTREVGRTRVPLEKWPIKFSGENNISLTDFLSRVDMYARADDVTPTQLFKSFFKILEGVALEWYEINAYKFMDWNGLVRGLKKRFLPKHYEFMMREEILSRMQEPNETISIFLMYMTKLFRKFYPPLDEEYQVYVLLRNMLPQYRLQLTNINIETTEQLEQLCQNLDEARLMDQRVKSCGKGTAFLETACFPRRRGFHQCQEVEEVAEVRFQPNQTEFRNRERRRFVKNASSGGLTCWNCHEMGHRHFDCSKPRTRIYCWCCGREGVTASQCSRNHKGGSLFALATQASSEDHQGNENSG